MSLSSAIRVGSLFTVSATCILGAATTSLAGTVTEFFGASGWKAQYDDEQVGFVDLVFDGMEDTNGDGVLDTIVIQKSAEFFNIGVISIVFNQIAAPTAGVNITHIAIEDESLTNSTGFDWTDFHFQILDSGDAAFDPAKTLASGGPAVTGGFYVGPFTNLVYSGDFMTVDVFGGGTVMDGETWFPGTDTVTFGPGGRLYMSVYSASGLPGDPFTNFTLKENPTIPAPGVLALLGVAGLTCSRRRR